MTKAEKYYIMIPAIYIAALLQSWNHCIARRYHDSCDLFTEENT